MKPKLLVVTAVLIALAILALRTRLEKATVPSAPPAAAAEKAAPADPKSHPALASYRVYEDPAEEGALPYRGANYSAEVRRDGLRFQAGEHKISLRARRVEQGGAGVELSDGEPVKTRWAAASVERAEGIAEEFVFENRRAEHLVRVDRPVGDGALVVRVAVETSLTGEVRQVRRGDSSWKDTLLSDGGLVFTDASGKPGLAYHGAVAVDAAGRRQLFDPRWENGEIALEVPASFMKDAAYPVLIDPWLELDFSASGGGLSKNGSVSETPAIALLSDNSPAVAWSDASDGDFDIYFRYWNGVLWAALGSSGSPGGVSANTGTSVKPSIGFFTPTNTTLTHPFIAWEDDLNGTGTVNVFAKFWTGTAWGTLGGSATTSGISGSIGTPCRNPQAVGVAGRVVNDPLLLEPDRFETFPCVVWEIEGVGIVSRFFYPGDNRLQAPEAGWYAHPSGFFITQDSSASRPTAVIDSTNRLAVAWQASNLGVEFDIFAARSDLAVPYQVAAGTGVPGPGISSWVSLGNVSGGGAALSIQPSMTVDSADTLWIAWQETVGVEREIYVLFNSGGGWTEVGGSGSGLGVSGTTLLGATTTSSFPSITVNRQAGTVEPVVVWEDDVSGNTEIYVRRLNSGTSTWDQVADEGSAALVAPEVTGNTGGVSRTPGFSLQPKAIVTPNGSITVAWRDASTGTFDVYVRRYYDNSPTTLTQSFVSGGVATPLTLGGTSSSTTIRFSSIIVAESSTTPIKLRLQLEVAPINTPFSDDIILESLEVDSGGTATIDFTGLPNVNYHWRARSIDAAARFSPWTSFGGNADGQIDFRVDSNAVGSGVPNTVQGTSTEHKDKCGLAGLEALALLGLAALARRRRKA